jgi:hypothetical protein
MKITGKYWKSNMKLFSSCRAGIYTIGGFDLISGSNKQNFTVMEVLAT